MKRLDDPVKFNLVIEREQRVQMRGWDRVNWSMEIRDFLDRRLRRLSYSGIMPKEGEEAQF